MKKIAILNLFFFLSFILFAQENGGTYTSDDNTVLLMHFDGDATNSADVGKNGIAHGSGVSYETDGVHGQCLRLNNSTADKQSWIEVPYFDGLNASSEGLAVECWFKINSWGETTSGTRSLFHKDGKSWLADYEIFLWPEANEGRQGQVNLNCVDEETKNWGADAPIADILELNTWYYIVIYYNPYFIHEYVNEEGEQRQASSVYCLIRDENFEEIFASRGHTETPPTNSEGLFRIGFGGSGDSYFDGWIDELRISNSFRKYRDDVLANVDINAFPDSVFLPLKDNWTSYGWPLGELYPIDPATGEVSRQNGCGPTMLARAIHYWEYPRFPKGVTEHNWAGLDWYTNYDETEYLWDQILPFYDSKATEEELEPVEVFGAQVGVASKETFDNMYCMPKFLKENFLFSKKTRIVFEEEYTKEEWENIIRNELSKGRICMVGGWGHYYIINGYNSKNQFFTDYSFNDYYWNDIKDFDYGAMQDMIIYFEPDWGAKKLELNNPINDKSYKAGNNVDIQWTSENISNLILEYSSDAGKNWKTISDEVDASSGTYTWSVPQEISKTYKVRISDKEDLNVYRKTNQFEVYNTKSFDIEYPQLNTKFKSGTRQPVYWNSTGIGTLKLEYSINGQDWVLINDSVNAADGHTFVNLPKTVTDNIVLKATDINEPEQTFTSEKFKLITEQIWGGPYEVDDNTLLLMHFENNTSNEVNNQLLPIELNPIGIYEENFSKNRGKAFRIYNSDQFIGDAFHVKNSENLDLGNNWTMEAWVKVTSIGGERNVASLIFNKWDVFAISAAWQYFGAYVNFENGTKVEFGCPQKYTLNKWYHVAMISDATKETVSFYVHDKNAQVIYQDEKPFPEGSNGMVLKKEFINDGEDKNLVTIGGLGGGSNFELDGYLDEVRITKSSNLMDYIETVELPFYDDFNGDYENWTHFSNKGDENWHISGDDGIDGGKCARFYIITNPAQENDDWLLTKRFNSREYSRLSVSFKYWYYGNGEMPEIWYSSDFDRDFESANWTKVEYEDWGDEWTWNTASFGIQAPDDIITFAIHYRSEESKSIYYLMDNFRIEGIITSAKSFSNIINNLKVYPNPITSESVISFQTKTSGNINLSIYNIQGRKIVTLLNEKLNAGLHSISVSSALSASGVYFCKLITNEGISTKKLVINNSN